MAYGRVKQKSLAIERVARVIVEMRRGRQMDMRREQTMEG